MAKKRPLSDGSKTKKKKTKHLRSAPGIAARKGMKPASKIQNPFESIWSRPKSEVIGKKRKGEERRIGLARSLAVNKRNKTLLKDYQESRKASSFLDKRIGEGNEDLGEYEKAIMRLQKERQLKLKRESKYNLSDEEEDNLNLGNDFPTMDDFEEEIPLDDDDNDADPEKMRNTKLSLQRTCEISELDLSEGNKNEVKTKKQVYEEIMAKSKFHKALKARNKEDDEHLMEQLDKDFTSLAQSEALLSLTQPAKVTALKALLNRNHMEQFVADKHAFSSESLAVKEKPDGYDMLVKEMVLDIRARPSDRTKTPEEIAQEERERLELLEEERQKRMLAIEDSGDESSDGAGDLKLSSKKHKHISGDDFGDSISFEEQPAKETGWVDMIMEKRNDENDEEEGGSSSNGSAKGDSSDTDADGDSLSNDDDDNSECERDSENFTGNWEESEQDYIVHEVERMEGNDQEKRKPNNKENAETNFPDGSTRSSKEVAMLKDESLPFVIQAPNNLQELCSLLDHRSDSQISEAISRIRACNSIRLSAENRKKMQVFYGVLLQYFAILAIKRPTRINTINMLVRPLLEMSAETPYFAAICARQRLIHIRTQFCEDIKSSEKSGWPSLKTLFLLKLWSLIFPCSDFRHVVMTPATLLMCEYLMRCTIMSGRDIAVGSLLCSMILSVARQCGKYFPEAIVFIQGLLMTATNMKQGLQQLSEVSLDFPITLDDYHFVTFCLLDDVICDQYHHSIDTNSLKPWLCIRNQTSESQQIDFLMVMDIPENSSFYDSDEFRVNILSSLTEILRGFISIYERLSSFPEIFLPIAVLLDEVVKQDCMPAILKGSMVDISQLVRTKASDCQLNRQPLQLRKKKPEPLKLLAPKFEDDFVKGRDYDPDRERAERKKLKKLLKREAKGAARELRKDNYFLFEAKERDRLLQEEERAESYGKSRAFLQEQEHAFKSGQLGKGKGMKRRK